MLFHVVPPTGFEPALTAPEAVARLRLYLRRLPSERSAGPRLVRRAQMTLSMRTTGTSNVRYGSARLPDCRAPGKAAVVHPGCRTSLLYWDGPARAYVVIPRLTRIPADLPAIKVLGHVAGRCEVRAHRPSAAGLRRPTGISWLAILGRECERLRRRAAPHRPRQGREGPAHSRPRTRVHA